MSTMIDENEILLKTMGTMIDEKAHEQAQILLKTMSTMIDEKIHENIKILRQQMIENNLLLIDAIGKTCKLTTLCNLMKACAIKSFYFELPKASLNLLILWLSPDKSQMRSIWSS